MSLLGLDRVSHHMAPSQAPKAPLLSASLHLLAVHLPSAVRHFAVDFQYQSHSVGTVFTRRAAVLRSGTSGRGATSENGSSCHLRGAICRGFCPQSKQWEGRGRINIEQIWKTTACLIFLSRLCICVCVCVWWLITKVPVEQLRGSLVSMFAASRYCVPAGPCFFWL